VQQPADTNSQVRGVGAEPGGGGMEIRTYDPGDWPALRAFIHEHWRAGHPYTDRVLFEWQFMGFASERPVSKLVEHEGQIAGFLGGTPGLYWANGTVLPGVVYDLWVVRPDLRNGALGLLMMKALEDEFDVCCCLGINPDVVRYYTARGYDYAPALHRWIVPLNRDGFNQLVATHPARPDTAGVTVPDLSGVREAESLRSPDTLALQIMYERTVEAAFRLALHRNAEFWSWRYLRSAGFKYQMFGSVVDVGIIVARIESIISPEHPQADGKKVLRLIECLPARPDTWNGQPDDAHLALLRSVLAWGARKQCILADFQHSSDRLGHVLEAAGFIAVSPTAPAAVRAVPNLFQPLQYERPPINYVWRLAGSAAPERPIESRDIYLVKSDDGMDRPNIWPMPAGRA